MYNGLLTARSDIKHLLSQRLFIIKVNDPDIWHVIGRDDHLDQSHSLISGLTALSSSLYPHIHLLIQLGYSGNMLQIILAGVIP